MSKRPIRKARRKARRAKVKTEIDRVREWREAILATLEDLEKRVSDLEALPLTDQGERIQRIEAFLGKDFIRFLEPMFKAQSP